MDRNGKLAELKARRTVSGVPKGTRRHCVSLSLGAGSIVLETYRIPGDGVVDIVSEFLCRHSASCPCWDSVLDDFDII
jgi:hypothetical protein